MRLQFNKFYSPDDSPGTSSQGDGSGESDETFELLNVEAVSYTHLTLPTNREV